MATYSVWLTDEESAELQKKLGNGETANQFVKALVQKFLDPNVVVWNCSEEEIAEIDSKRNERSRDEYLRKLIQEERPESSKPEDEGVTKIDFRTLLGEELFIKVHAEAGDNLQEYLQKILLQQTNENAIIVDCPEDEIEKIDALRNDKSRPEYLRGLIAKDQNEQPPPAVNGSFGEQIKTQILGIHGWIKTQTEELKDQTKTLHGTMEKDHKTILSLLKERLPYPESWGH